MPDQQDQKVDISALARAPSGEAAPPIPLPKMRWRTRILLPGAVLLLFAGLLLYAARDALLPAREIRVVPVIAKASTGGSGTVSFQAAGWIEADPFSSYVPALTDGVVKELLVLEGEKVEAGQVVARMVDDDAKLALALAEANVLQRQADIATAEAAITAAQMQWDNPVERVRAVSAAESMLAESNAEYARSEADAAMQKARADELKDQLQREDSLADVKAMADGQRVQTRLRLKTQEATVAAAEQTLGVSNAKIKLRDAELLAATENLRLRIPETKELASSKAALQQAHAAHAMAEASRDEARLRLKRMEIRAPVSGVVMQRLTEPGSKLMQNGTEMHAIHVLKIYNPEKLQVRVDVPLANAAQVSVGQEATITAEVLRDTTFHGKVLRILHEADIQKNTLQVKVSIEKPAFELRPEMLARVQFIAAARAPLGTAATERLFVPESLLQREAGQAYAWIVDKGRQVAVRRNVTVGGGRDADCVEITDGLKIGDLVIAEPSGLREGQRVRVTGESDIKSGAGHASH